MDFEALIKKHLNEDGSVDVGKLATAIASNVGREFVEKKRYNDKLDEIETLKTAKQEAEDSAAANASWKQKHDDLEQKFNDYKAQIAGKETLAAKKTAFRKLLDAKNIDSADADLIMAATQFDSMKLDKDGQLENSDALVKSIEDKYGRYIPEIRSKGTDPATPPRENGGSGANPRAAKIAQQRAERLWGANNNKEVKNT